ncbi:hypothetical protein QQP08_004911 [Theobroma cacao]|nr:hypothetical protein QQP08_004911 [Theobroma cacao]
MVKSTHHSHPLDDIKEYYSDIREEERFANVTSIIVKNVEEVLSWPVSRIRNKFVELEEEIEDRLRDFDLF